MTIHEVMLDVISSFYSQRKFTMLKRRTVALFLLLPAAVILLTHWNGSVGQEAAAPQRQSQLTAKPLEDEPQQAGKVPRAKNKERSLDKFMQQKLTASTNILEGLMTEDLKLVADNANQLLEMSKEERWRASNDMLYLQHSNQFRNAVDDLYKKAEKNSTEGASLAWINVTMSCIKCHEWVRNVVLADLDGPAQPALRE